MMLRSRFLSAVGGIAIVALLLSIFIGNGVSAQSPVATPGGTVAHPAHIHSGTCDQLGDVVYPLMDLMAPGTGGTPAAETQGSMTEASPVAADGGQIVAESITIVNTTMDELLAAPHAINVHESAENIGNYIACGDISAESETMGSMGTPTTEGRQLEFALQELNASGYEGHAYLVEMADGTVQVTVHLMQVEGTGMEAGSPQASPTS